MYASEKKEFLQSHSVGPDLMDAVSSCLAYSELDQSGQFKFVNTNYANIFGYLAEDMTNKYDREFDKAMSDGEYDKWWESVLSGKTSREEIMRRGKNDKIVWLSIHFFRVIDESGVVKKVFSFASDITDTRIELETRTEIMNVTSIVSEANLKGEILSVNDKFIEVSKYERDELIGRPHNTTRHQDMKSEVFKNMWSTIGRGQMFRGVVKNKAKDGTPYYVDAVIAPILGENGKPKKYLGVRYDITESEIERQNMRGILNAVNSSFAYVEFDVNGNITKTNEIFRETMLYSEPELLGKHHQLLCEAELYKSREYSDFWKDLKEGNSKSGIFKRLDKHGQPVWLQAVYAPVVDEMGRVLKIVKLASNVKMLVSMQEMSKNLSLASNQLTLMASQMNHTAEKTSQDSLVAARASEQVSLGVQTVAANIDEMVSSIREIGKNTNDSSQMAKMTLEKARKSNEIIMKLGASSREIGDVIKVISSIAQQTNLLALNATIEAARAGDAGRGFAVVANEVKELAKQTARATDDITNKIGAIQTDTQSAIENIGDISAAIDKLNGVSGVIAAAVEQQTATTNEIFRVVQNSKHGVEEIVQAISSVSLGAHESSESSLKTLSASKELLGIAEELSNLGNT